MGRSFPDIQDPSELKNLSLEELQELARLCRREIINTVSKNGGHLASNLGVVELTLALGRTFDFGPGKDRIIFDVGHQVYTWKLITGRSKEFASLRQMGGLAGFPKRSESPYDFYNSGHSSTSISLALGFERADRLNGLSHQNVALVGDGALTGGMAFEALNDAGQSQDPIKVILNDNQMSIDPNVSALARHLENIRISRSYFDFKKKVKSSLEHGFRGAERLKNFLSVRKRKWRIRLHKDSILFEGLGFRYYGPVDGHNLEELLAHLEAVKLSDKPTILHVVTKKGYGYLPAEEAPDRFHGVAPFVLEGPQERSEFTNVSVGKGLPLEHKADRSDDTVTIVDNDSNIEGQITSQATAQLASNGPTKQLKSFSQYVSDFLLEAAGVNDQVVAITAAMAQGTGLSKLVADFPDRVFDTGIAEQHAVSLGAGLSLAGKRVFVALYSTFSQRAVDQILHDVCLQNLPVCFLIDRAGVVGADGETHQGLYDLSIFSSFPNLSLYSPADGLDLELLIKKALTVKSPLMIRYPKAKTLYDIGINNRSLEGLRLVRPGKEWAIIAYGSMLQTCLDAADILANNDHSIAVYSFITSKNMQINDKIETLSNFKRVSIVEDGIRTGGMAEQLSLRLCENGLKPALLHTVENGLRGQATREELLREESLDPQSIAQRILQLLD